MKAIATLLAFTCFYFHFGSAAAERALGLSGDLGMGGFNGKAVTTIQTGVDVQEGNLALGLFGRVRFLMQEDPDNGPVRSRDWDEASDYVHILRYLQYKRSFATKKVGEVRLGFQAGEILGYTLGHGTLIRDYSNISDPDHPHAGIHIHVAGPRWQVASMVDNFINPSVVATRVAAKPLGQLPRLALGTSLAIDPRAPVEVSDQRDVDEGYNLRSTSKPLTLLGIDAEYVVGDADRGRVTPYLDFNTSMLGVGLHVGASGDAPLPKDSGRLFGQIEYRVGSGGYAPAHMETFYDVERYQAGLSFNDPAEASHHERSTKLAGLARGIYGGQGLLAQAGYRLRSLVQLKAGVSYRQGPDSLSIWGRGTARPIPRLQLGLLMLARGVGGPHSGAEGLMAIAEGRLRLTQSLYTLCQYTRAWALRSDDRYYGILQSFNISLGATWSG